jgi:hypothetical protein
MFFYQLFFNSPLNNASKHAFFNYLITHHSTIYYVNTIIKIALESPRFKIDHENKTLGEWNEKLHLITGNQRNKILERLGFSSKEIKNEEQRIAELKKLLEDNKATRI